MRNWGKYSRIADHKWSLTDIGECDASVAQEKNFYVGSYTSAELTEATHSHEFVQIYYMLSGILEHTVENDTGSLSVGDIFIIPPETQHSVAVNGDCSAKFASIGFMPEFVDFSPVSTSFLSTFLNFICIESVITEDVKIRSRIIFNSDQQIIVNGLINEMLKEYTQRRDGYITCLKGLLLQLLVIIAREYAAEPYYMEISNKMQTHHSAMAACIQYVNTNYTNDMKIDNVARSFQFSRCYFCELFKKFTGKTFNEYVIDMRIGRAKELLRGSELSITEISYECGYNDTSSFSRSFSKRIGVSPSNYRKMP